MVDIKVLGVGCKKCQKLYDETAAAAEEIGAEVNLEKVEQVPEIAKYGVLVTPALVVDGKVCVSGRVPRRKQIAAWISEATE